MLTTDQRHLSVMCVCVCVRACMCAESCLTLCSPMACGPPGSSVHGILQVGILQWVAISFSRGSSGSRVKPASPALGGEFFTPLPPGKQFYLTFTSHLIEMPAYD